VPSLSSGISIEREPIDNSQKVVIGLLLGYPIERGKINAENIF